MAKPLLHARLALHWPIAEPAPLAPEAVGLKAIFAAIRAKTEGALVPKGRLDPVAIPHLPYVPARGRLALLDRLLRTTAPTDAQVIDRFIDAYLLLASQGFMQVPGLSPRRRALARTTLRAMELMNRLFRETWQRQMAAPPGWWRRFLETYRAAGEARLFTIRRPLFQARGEATVQQTAATTLLHAVANPFAWERELYTHLERLIRLFGDDVLLFPAASPSAYAQGRPGRFVFDTHADRAPAPPEGLPRSPDHDRPPKWWIMDTSRVLVRLAEFRRNLALGVAPQRIHGSLAEIPEPTRSILIRRLERMLARPGRLGREPATGKAHLVAGLEQTVRHSFAKRWSGTRDMATLDANVRMQSEVGTRGATGPDLRPWRILDRHGKGLRLHGEAPPGPPLTGRVAGVLETGAEGWPDDHPFRAGIVRWQMNHPGTGQAEIGLDILPGPPEDCWFRVVQGPGSTLHEFPALLLPANRETGPSLLIPAGLFQPGGLVTLRTDDRDHPATLVHAVELGVHFEHIEIRLQGPA